MFFLVGLAAHSLIAVLARAFYARQDTLTPVLAAVARGRHQHDARVVLVGPLGLAGIALAIAIAAWLEAVALVVILDRRLPDFRAARPRPASASSRSSARSSPRVVADGDAPRDSRSWLGADPDEARARSSRSPSRARSSARSTPASRSCCGSPNCPLSSGSWSTCSAARAGRDGARPSAAAWDAFVAASDPGSYLQLTAWAAVKAVNGWTVAPASSMPTAAGSTPIGAQILVRRPAADAVGLRYAPARPGRARLVGGRASSAFTEPAGPGLRRDRRAGSATCASTRRSRPTDRSTPTGRSGARCRAAGWRAGPAHPAGLDPDHRPARRRGRPVGRPAQEVAPVREQGPRRPGSSSSTPRATASASSTGSTARPRTGPAS